MNFGLTFVLEQDEQGLWHAEVLELPGGFSQGRTPEEAKSMALDAAKTLAEYRRDEALAARPSGRVETLTVVI